MSSAGRRAAWLHSNNFVGAGEQRRRHVEAERLCRLDHSSRRLRPIVIAADATLVKPALVRYLDRTKSRPFRPNCSQCFSDSIPDDIAFVGGRMIDTDFDSNLLSSLLAAHCPIPDVGNWIGGGSSRVNISVVILSPLAPGERPTDPLRTACF